MKQLFRSLLIMKNLSILILLAFLNSLTACSYYKIRTMTPSSRKSDNPIIQKNIEESLYFEIKNAIKSENYVILHQGTNPWHLKDITIDKEKNEVRAYVEEVGYNHKYYLKAHRGANRYRKELGSPTKDVQLYVTKFELVDSARVIIPITAISKIEFYKKDNAATTIRASLVAIPSAIAAFVLVALSQWSNMTYTI